MSHNQRAVASHNNIIINRVFESEQLQRRLAVIPACQAGPEIAEQVVHLLCAGRQVSQIEVVRAQWVGGGQGTGMARLIARQPDTEGADFQMAGLLGPEFMLQAIKAVEQDKVLAKQV